MLQNDFKEQQGIIYDEPNQTTTTKSYQNEFDQQQAINNDQAILENQFQSQLTHETTKQKQEVFRVELRKNNLKSLLHQKRLNNSPKVSPFNQKSASNICETNGNNNSIFKTDYIQSKQKEEKEKTIQIMKEIQIIWQSIHLDNERTNDIKILFQDLEIQLYVKNQIDGKPLIEDILLIETGFHLILLDIIENRENNYKKQNIQLIEDSIKCIGNLLYNSNNCDILVLSQNSRVIPVLMACIQNKQINACQSSILLNVVYALNNIASDCEKVKKALTLVNPSLIDVFLPLVEDQTNYDDELMQNILSLLKHCCQFPFVFTFKQIESLIPMMADFIHMINSLNCMPTNDKNKRTSEALAVIVEVTSCPLIDNKDKMLKYDPTIELFDSLHDSFLKELIQAADSSQDYETLKPALELIGQIFSLNGDTYTQKMFSLNAQKILFDSLIHKNWYIRFLCLWCVDNILRTRHEVLNSIIYYPQMIERILSQYYEISERVQKEAQKCIFAMARNCSLDQLKFIFQFKTAEIIIDMLSKNCEQQSPTSSLANSRLLMKILKAIYNILEKDNTAIKVYQRNEIQEQFLMMNLENKLEYIVNYFPTSNVTNKAQQIISDFLDYQEFENDQIFPFQQLN